MELYAPFLSKYGFLFLPLLIGVLSYWCFTRFLRNKTSGKDSRSNVKSSGISLNSGRIIKSTDYDARVHDEDNHVFQDKVEEFQHLDDVHPIHGDGDVAQVIKHCF